MKQRFWLAVCVASLFGFAMWANAEFPFQLDGNVVGEGAEWNDALLAFDDGDDARDGDSGPRYDDNEDINTGHLWIDLEDRRIYYTMGFMDQVFPNKQWAYMEGIRDRGYHGWYFDIDNNQETGLLTDKDHHGELTFAWPLIGFDFGFDLGWDTRDLGDGVYVTSEQGVAGIWTKIGEYSEALLGYDFDQVEGGPNAAWFEGYIELDPLIAALQAHNGSVWFQKGQMIGVAGHGQSPVPFDNWGEEITNGGYYLVGWGPVDWDPDEGAMTFHAPEIVDGLAITYDSGTDIFSVATDPVSTFSASPHVTPVAINTTTWGDVKTLYR